MRNQELWTPSKVIRNTQKKCFEPNLKVVYPGSTHIASLQIKWYNELINKYIKGKILDCGCGSVPYFEIYKNQVSEVVCLDLKSPEGRINHLDIEADLNNKLPLPDNSFDSILLTDVLCHVHKPFELINELSRILKPGGHLFIATPFQAWMSDYPHQYFHATDRALELMCKEAGLKVVELESYGGFADIRLDNLNKRMTGKWSNRIFRLLAKLLIKTNWYKRTNEKNKYHYSIGFVLIATK